MNDFTELRIPPPGKENRFGLNFFLINRKEQTQVHDLLDRLSDGLFSQVVDGYSKTGFPELFITERQKPGGGLIRQAQFFTTDPNLQSNDRLGDVQTMVKARMIEDEKAESREIGGEKYVFKLPGAGSFCEECGGEVAKQATLYEDEAYDVVDRATKGDVEWEIGSSRPLFPRSAPPVYQYEWTFWRSAPWVKFKGDAIEKAAELDVQLKRVTGIGLGRESWITGSKIVRNPLGITTLRLLEAEYPNPLDPAAHMPGGYYSDLDWAVSVSLPDQRIGLGKALRLLPRADLENFFQNYVIDKGSSAFTNTRIENIGGFDTRIEYLQTEQVGRPITAVEALKNSLTALSFPIR